jgi:hypothetical protein
MKETMEGEEKSDEKAKSQYYFSNLCPFSWVDSGVWDSY